MKIKWIEDRQGLWAFLALCLAVAAFFSFKNNNNVPVFEKRNIPYASKPSLANIKKNDTKITERLTKPVIKEKSNKCPKVIIDTTPTDCLFRNVK